MKILFACSECSSFAASGGLADVAGSLPAALQKEGAECRVILPLYGSIGLQWRSSMTFLTSFGVPLSWRVAHCGVFTLQHGGVQYYFLDNEQYFKREGGIYGYFDEAERFAFFSKAVLETLTHIDYEPDVIHCNDWQTAPHSGLSQCLLPRRAKALRNAHRFHHSQYPVSGAVRLRCRP